MNYDAQLDIDGQGRPIYGDSPFKATKDHAFVATGASTTVVPLFTLTGAVMITRLWGVVTTDIAANHTKATPLLNILLHQPESVRGRFQVEKGVWMKQ